MYEVYVRGLAFYGYHGCTDAEQAIGRRYQADINAEVQGTADETDSLDDTVNYVELANLMNEMSGADRYRTLEALAHAYCVQALTRFPKVSAVEVDICKPMPPAGVLADATGVRYRYERS